MIFESQTTIFELKLGSKWIPNRIIDAGSVRKPLESLLTLSGWLLGALEGFLEAFGSHLGCFGVHQEHQRGPTATWRRRIGIREEYQGLPLRG